LLEKSSTLRTKWKKRRDISEGGSRCNGASAGLVWKGPKSCFGRGKWWGVVLVSRPADPSRDWQGMKILHEEEGPHREVTLQSLEVLPPKTLNCNQPGTSLLREPHHGDCGVQKGEKQGAGGKKGDAVIKNPLNI